MKLTFLGTGTSTGVPQLRCGCATCRSEDPRDRRMRCSAMLEYRGKRILIDCGPDFHQQMLNNGRRSADDNIDLLLVTHQHYDHVGGIDDLRPYCYRDGQMYHFPVYCQADVSRDLRRRLPYCFSDNPYPGVPQFDLRVIHPFRPFKVDGDIEILPVEINHSILEIVGFRIGPLAYVTDAKFVPEATVEALKGVDTLVINALRKKPHGSHQTLAEALEVIEKIGPRVAYLTHLSHDMGLHAEVSMELPENVFIAYDGLTITIPDHQ